MLKNPSYRGGQIVLLSRVLNQGFGYTGDATKLVSLLDAFSPITG